MTTHQFFIKRSQIDKHRMLTIRGRDARHMALVLRLKKGSRVKLVDETQQLYFGLVQKISSDAARISIEAADFCTPEQARVDMVLGVPRLPKADLIVQKLTELGIGKMTFVQMKRSPYADAFQRTRKRLERLQTIAEAAAKQCGRRCIPLIEAAGTLADVFRREDTQNVRLVANENYSGKSLADSLAAVAADSPVTIFVGPEGGFSEEEIDFLRSKNTIEFSLGRNILRTETAAIVAAAIVLYELGEM
jgi:16S rRNA (uracil1498-N3)-methyltransferase